MVRQIKRLEQHTQQCKQNTVRLKVLQALKVSLDMTSQTTRSTNSMESLCQNKERKSCLTMTTFS
jgi:hypothetical protein